MRANRIFSLIALAVFLGVAAAFFELSTGTAEDSREILPQAVEGIAGSERAQYSGRTLSLAVQLDRAAARLIAFTLKNRPFVRPLRQAAVVPYAGGRQLQLEVVLLGPKDAGYTQRILVSGICLAHPGDDPPHIEGDTILLHRDTLIIEVPEIAGFRQVEIAIYLPGALSSTRRLLATLALQPEEFVAAGSAFSWSDLAIARPGEASSPETPADRGAVHWPEEYGDPDRYKVYGNETETNRRINVAIIPDGYLYSEKSLMESHASSLVAHFRTKTPYQEHDPFINYNLVYAYSTESGTDQCDCGIIKDTPMSTRFPNAGYPCGDSGNRCLYYGSGCDSDTSSNIALAELRAPAADKTVVMVNTARYGGCGGSRAVYSAANASAEEVAVHELGHSLGGLADEYIAYSGCGTSAGEINTSLNATIGAWPEWIADLGSPRQGAQYYSLCIYRPQDNCVMRALGLPFCSVCSQHYSLVFFGHPRVFPTAPIESQSPASQIYPGINIPVNFSVATRLAAGANVRNASTWRLQGPGFPNPTIVANDTFSYTRPFALEGNYTLTCELVADTNFIKPSKNGANVDTVQWMISAKVNPALFITISKATYVNGETATASEFRLQNAGSQQGVAELKVWLELPEIAPISFISAGSDGGFVIPAGFNQDFGPIALFPVTQALPRGAYELNSRLVDPVTGRLLSEDLNPFVIQ